MKSNLIALAVPFFFLAILIEAVISRRKKLGVYRLHDSLSNLSGGIGHEVLGGFTAALGIYAYDFLQTRYGLLKISTSSVAAWLVLLVAYDFCYYLYHWASHRVNFLWATHAVHHQSEEYNLSVALRQSWFTRVTSWVFYVPLALLGFPLVMYLTIGAINLLYQFWIHTRPVGRLGAFEWFMNTPSHHRVHHGIDPRYIDKNHGGMFIIFDRLFGTFIEERGEPVYGTVKPLSTYDPIWANLVEWARLWGIARRTRRLADKLKIWFMPPEWHPADLGGVVEIPEVSRASQRKYDVHTAPAITAYATFSFALVLVASVYFLWVQHQLELGLRTAYVGEVILGLYTVAALVEGRPHARPLEVLRLLSVAALAVLVPMPLRAVLLGAVASSLGAVLYLQLRVHTAPRIETA
ncbi:MAG: sterol desaturase family protein [Polyangia bacterium]